MIPQAGVFSLFLRFNFVKSYSVRQKKLISFFLNLASKMYTSNMQNYAHMYLLFFALKFIKLEAL